MGRIERMAQNILNSILHTLRPLADEAGTKQPGQAKGGVLWLTRAIQTPLLSPLGITSRPHQASVWSARQFGIISTLDNGVMAA